MAYSGMNTIDAFLNKQVRNGKTPSVQYVHFDRNDVIHRYLNGYADIDARRTVNERTTYNAFSVTKTFTALAVLQLAERSLLDIDSPVARYLPDFPYSAAITVEQLLTHSAGIPNPIPLKWIHSPEEHGSFERDDFFRAVFLEHNKTTSAPNAKYAYSNLGYVLLGQLIEKVSGLQYEEYVTMHIIAPLGLTPEDLGFTLNGHEVHAKGYHKRLSFSGLILGFLIDKPKFMDHAEGSWNSFEPSYVNGASYGGLIGTANALVKYLQELLKPETPLLTEAYKQLLFKENITAENKPTGMCLSWFKGELEGHTYYAHAGGGGGYYCEIRIYPALEKGSVIMFNRTGMSDERILDRVDRRTFAPCSCSAPS